MSLLAYLAVGTVGALVFLSIVADDVQRIRVEQDARKAAEDRKRDIAARQEAAVEHREAAEKRREERRERLLGGAAEVAGSPESVADEGSPPES